MSVVKQQQANLNGWKNSVSYGHRWMTETAFSSIKRMFGEHVTAKLSIKLFIYESGPNHEEMEDVLCT
jgi:hypothetical protein